MNSFSRKRERKKTDTSKKSKITLAKFIATLALLSGIPMGIISGHVFYYNHDLNPVVRYATHFYGILLSYPFSLGGVYLIDKKPKVALPLVLSGIPVRMFGLMFLVLLVIVLDRSLYKEVVMIYFFTVANFLFFELVSLAGLEFYASKIRNQR